MSISRVIVAEIEHAFDTVIELRIQVILVQGYCGGDR